MSLSRKDIAAGAVALLVVLVVAVVPNWSSLTSSFTNFIIRSDLTNYAVDALRRWTGYLLHQTRSASAECPAGR
jgi:hypothetical protein